MLTFSRNVMSQKISYRNFVCQEISYQPFILPLKELKIVNYLILKWSKNPHYIFINSKKNNIVLMSHLHMFTFLLTLLWHVDGMTVHLVIKSSGGNSGAASPAPAPAAPQGCSKLQFLLCKCSRHLLQFFFIYG